MSQAAKMLFNKLQIKNMFYSFNNIYYNLLINIILPYNVFTQGTILLLATNQMYICGFIKVKTKMFCYSQLKIDFKLSITKHHKVQIVSVC